MTSLSEGYERGLAIYNTGDVERYAQEYADDALLVRPDGVARGRAAIAARWAAELAAFPDRVLIVETVVEQGDLVVVEWTWTGTNTGPRRAPDGPALPPTGRRVEVTGVELAWLRDGLIARLHMYWDRASIQQQLGQVDGSPA
jgi:steroid delta-isomerase-like uncharacterized protein